MRGRGVEGEVITDARHHLSDCLPDPNEGRGELISEEYRKEEEKE